MPDIDIDFADRNQALAHIKHIKASRKDMAVHNTGVYLHSVPVHAPTGLCAIPYEEAEDQGYFKIDFLNVGIYKEVRSEEHLESLMNTEPLWDLLEQDEFSSMLFHVNGHGSILRTMKPKTIPQLAAVLAMIRPAKRHLLGKSWKDVEEEVWVKPASDEYFFKKSHAIAYATAVVVQMNLICEKVSYGFQ